MSTDEFKTATELRRDGGHEPAVVGINVGHCRNAVDVYGGRKRVNGDLRHMDNAEPGTPGWLGNPFSMDDAPDDADARRWAIERFADYFLARVENDAELRREVERLRSRSVGCWCRGISTPREAGPWCHLDVIDCWLRGDLDAIEDYLAGGDDE